MNECDASYEAALSACKEVEARGISAEHLCIAREVEAQSEKLASHLKVEGAISKMKSSLGKIFELSGKVCERYAVSPREAVEAVLEDMVDEDMETASVERDVESGGIISYM